DALGAAANEMGWQLIENLPMKLAAEVAPIVQAESQERQASYIALEEMGRQIQLAAASVVDSPEVEVGKKQLEVQEKTFKAQEAGLAIFTGIKTAVEGLNLGVR